MSHIFLGLMVDGISKAPFTSVFTRNIKFRANNINIKSLPGNTRFIILPNIAGYVISDTLGVAISTDIINRQGNWLALDIGTNCELILKTNERILTCSTAAGPAFEGGNMSCGMRAEPGSVYSINISDDIYPKTIEDKEPTGICGSGYIEIVASLLNLNLIKRVGRIKKVQELEGEIPTKILNRIEKTDKGKKIIIDKIGKVYINQEDISNLQLAKVAVKAGIDIMVKEGNIDKLDGVLLAGAFGSNLDVESLKTISMLSHMESEKIETVGNAAGSGAIDVILYKEIYDDIIKRYIENEQSLYNEINTYKEKYGYNKRGFNTDL